MLGSIVFFVLLVAKTLRTPPQLSQNTREGQKQPSELDPRSPACLPAHTHFETLYFQVFFKDSLLSDFFFKEIATFILDRADPFLKNDAKTGSRSAIDVTPPDLPEAWRSASPAQIFPYRALNQFLQLHLPYPPTRNKKPS